MLEEWCISVRGQRAAEDRRALRINSRYIARITELVVNGVGRSPPGCPAQNGPPGPVIEDELRGRAGPPRQFGFRLMSQVAGRKRVEPKRSGKDHLPAFHAVDVVDSTGRGGWVKRSKPCESCSTLSLAEGWWARNERSVTRLIRALRYLDFRLRSARASPLADCHLGTWLG